MPLINAVKQAVILCGGFGTRMGALSKVLPKPMIPISEVPLLERLIRHLHSHGINKFVLAAHYKAEIIDAHFRSLAIPGLSVEIVTENEPLGTAGPLRLLDSTLDEEFLVVYGDEFLDCDISALVRDHLENQALATVLVRPSHHPWDGHLFQTNGAGRITGFARTYDAGARLENLGNLGVYVLSRNVLKYIPVGRKSGFAEDVFPVLISEGLPVRAHLLESGGYVKDVGTPDRIEEVERYLADRDAVLKARSVRGPITMVFLDRDGVIVRDNGLVSSVNSLELLPGAAEGIHLLNRQGIRVVVVTNQPQVARGMITESGLEEIHAELGRRLAASGAAIDAIYYCPHHPETQHGEGIRELRRGCECRKPRPGMIFQARRDLGVDLSGAVMIGDSSTDVEAGRNAGLKTILVETGAGRLQAGGAHPDYSFPTLLAAVTAIIGGRIQ